MSKPHGHSVDDYLEAIYFLVSPIGEYQPAPVAIAARVADLLGVSRTAVGEMLKRLVADGLLEGGTGRELVLTPAGYERAEGVVRRNRIGGPENVIDITEERAPDGFQDIDDILSFEERKRIVEGYASTAGFSLQHVNRR